MDWEDRFSSIVRETEANLAKAKHRLGAPRPSRSSSSTGAYGAYSSLSPDNDFSGASLLSSTPKVRFGSTYSKEEELPVPSTRGHHSLEQSPAVILLLEDKLEQQSRLIELLQKSLKKLQNEKEENQKQMKAMKDDLSMLKERVLEKGIDFNTEKKIEQWKRDMTMEMSLLESRFQVYKTGDDNRGITESQIASVIREAHDIKRFVQEECESLRRELESTKTRLVKLELDMHGVVSDNKDVIRRHDRLERNVRDVADSQLTHSRNLNRTLDEREQEKLHINELRATIRTLRDKLSNMESQMSDTDLLKQENKPKSTRRTKQKTKAITQNTDNRMALDSSDLDLSSSPSLADYSSSDFSFSAKPKQRSHKLIFEEELDLDDLDLSDAESLSIATLQSD